MDSGEGVVISVVRVLHLLFAQDSDRGSTMSQAACR